MLSDEWLPRYGLKQNLKVGDGNGNVNANANANADAKVTTIALPVLCTGELIKSYSITNEHTDFHMIFLKFACQKLYISPLFLWRINY